jgi:uncharacterized coiled-coil DUF342 family protein
MSTETVSADEFQALEQKVLQTVELIRKEREARHLAEAERDAAQAETAKLREQVDSLSATSEGAHSELATLKTEREAVKTRVERMLAQMDELL